MKNDLQFKKVIFKNESKTNIKELLILAIVFSLCILSSIIFYSIDRYIINNYRKNMSTRILSIMPKDSNLSFYEYNKNKKDYMHEISNMENVLGVYEVDNYELSAAIADIEGYDGSISIIGLNKKSLKSLFNIDDDFFEDNNLVCPNNFIPDIYAESPEYPKKEIIDIKNILGHYYTINFKNNEKEQQQKYKIYKGYSSENNYTYNNECYTYEDNLLQLKDELFKNDNLDSEISGIYVLVDNYKNVNKVFQKFEDMGYYVIQRFSFDSTSISVIYIICNILFFTSIAFGYTYLSTMTKKYLIKNKQRLVLLMALGFKNKEILNLYRWQINMSIFKSLILSLLIMGATIFIMNNKLFSSIYFMNFELIFINYITIVILLILLLLINCIVKKVVNEYYQNSIICSIKETL